MNQGLQITDYVIFIGYFIIVTAVGYFIYKQKSKGSSSSHDFFLAEGSLTWWAIGASLIASNISAEQFVGMSGSGFALGLGIATYEWMAAITLIVVAVFFMPIYLKNKIYTMPQFLAQRFDNRVSTLMAILWLIVYVFVNLTSIIYLGALSVEKMTGINFIICAMGLSGFALLITLGGMKVIGYTDVIQVFFLVMGGLATTYLALDLVSLKVGTGQGWTEGLSLLGKLAPDHFHMIFKEGQTQAHNGQGGYEDAYQQLPGLAVLFGGMWIANLSYWGCNQYITQRALGAPLPTARKGLLFAAFLKLLMPAIVVVPGIAAYVIFSQNADPVIVNGLTEVTAAGQQIVKPDNSYPVLLNLLPVGLKGLAFAALTAAIVASLAGKANSISTIFSLDIYKKYFNKEADDKSLVFVGRYVVIIAFVIALLVSPALKYFGKGFQYIQEYTGFLSPGVFAIFMFGLFWKRITANAALFAALATIPFSVIIKVMYPEIPFINRMSIVFILLSVGMIIISYAKPQATSKIVEVDTSMFRTTVGFTVGALVVMSAIATLYIVFW
jgi:solute:Na+ symporter, SSS family